MSLQRVAWGPVAQMLMVHAVIVAAPRADDRPDDTDSTRVASRHVSVAGTR
jgi:hypothetical protein